MTVKQPPSIRVGVYVSATLWHQFRVACVQRKLSSSEAIQQLIEQQLAAWQPQPQKEPDHA